MPRKKVEVEEAAEEVVEEVPDDEEAPEEKKVEVEKFKGVPIDEIEESGDEKLIEEYRDHYGLG